MDPRAMARSSPYSGSTDCCLDPSLFHGRLKVNHSRTDNRGIYMYLFLGDPSEDPPEDHLQLVTWHCDAGYFWLCKRYRTSSICPFVYPLGSLADHGHDIPVSVFRLNICGVQH